MAALLLGYIFALTSSSIPSRYASGRRTVTSLIAHHILIIFAIYFIMLCIRLKFKRVCHKNMRINHIQQKHEKEGEFAR